MTTPSTSHRARRAGVMATLAVSAVALVAGLFAAPAGAQTSDAEAAAAPRLQVTQEQRDCMAEQGYERPLAGELRTREQRQAFRDAAETCGIDLPAGFFRHAARRHARHWYRNLTGEQRQCLTDQGVERPQGRPTPDAVQAFRDAAAACGIELPGGAAN